MLTISLILNALTNSSLFSQLVDLTKCDCDKAALVLHDCDYDLMRAVDVILEGGCPVDVRIIHFYQRNL